MRGVILCGGNGTRLRPATNVYNKHLALVYDKPMIYYPIKTLKDSGYTDIVLVSGGEQIGGFTELLKDGSDLGVRLTYRVQPEAGGIAQALACAEGLVEDVFPVILGDNYFETVYPDVYEPTIFIKNSSEARRFGVYDSETNQITEKPDQDIGDIVTGLYYFDTRVFMVIRDLKPSDRGELEITDVNNVYLEWFNMQVRRYEGYWSDMGTPESLLEVANRVQQLPY